MKLLPVMTMALGIAVLVLIWYCKTLGESIIQLEKDFNELKIEMQENQNELTNTVNHYYGKMNEVNYNLEVELKQDMKELKDTCIDMNVKTREEILTLMQKGE